MIFEAAIVATITILILGFLITNWLRQLPLPRVTTWLAARRQKKQAIFFSALDAAIEEHKKAPQIAAILVQNLSKYPSSLKSTLAWKEHKEFHEQLLLRCVLLCEQSGRRFQELSTLEALLDEQANLLRDLLELEGQAKNLTGKRSEQGKKTPAWVQEEFNRKKDRLKEQLASNSRKLEDTLEAFSELFGDIKAS